MGFYLELDEGKTSRESRFLPEIKRLIREVDRLGTVFGGNLEKGDVDEACARVGRTLNLDVNAGGPSSWKSRKDFKIPKSGAMAKEIVKDKGKDDIIYVYFIAGDTFKDTVPNGTTFLKDYPCVTVQIKERKHLDTAKQMICPSCSKLVSEKNTSLAHNIISQRFWKMIIDEVFKEFTAIVEEGKMLKEALERKSPIHSTSMFGIKSGVKLTEQQRKALEYVKISEKAPEKSKDKTVASPQELNRAFVLRFIADSMLEKSQYAASGLSGRQCRDCEEVQGNATLLQRFALEKAGLIGDIAPELKGASGSVFVGNHMKAAINSEIKCGPKEKPVKIYKDGDDAMRQITRAQINRYLLGIEKTIDKIWDEACREADQGMKGKIKAKMSKEEEETAVAETLKYFAPLLLMVKDHYDEFMWTFRAVALRVAGMPYTGSFGATHFKDGAKI